MRLYRWLGIVVTALVISVKFCTRNPVITITTLVCLPLMQTQPPTLSGMGNAYRQAFAVVGPAAWNSLLSDIQCSTGSLQSSAATSRFMTFLTCHV